jgi:predicted nucleotide-binding protein
MFSKLVYQAAGCQDKRDQALRSWLQIFIGHGRNKLWRDIKDHLSEKHGFKVTAYETGARAGLHIVDVLKDVQKSTGFAILVMTAENKDIDEVMHARENVIHEIGLFQGQLGTNRAIVLLEEGCIPFSNLAGVQCISFSKDNIKETFGDVLATIRR